MQQLQPPKLINFLISFIMETTHKETRFKGCSKGFLFRSSPSRSKWASKNPKHRSPTFPESDPMIQCQSRQSQINPRTSNPGLLRIIVKSLRKYDCNLDLLRKISIGQLLLRNSQVNNKSQHPNRPLSHRVNNNNNNNSKHKKLLLLLFPTLSPN